MTFTNRANPNDYPFIKVIMLTVYLMIAFPLISFAGVIFSDDYDTPSASSTCADGIRSGYTSQGACTSSTYGSVTHYASEISSGGRSGNSLKFWRRNGIWTDYHGGYGKMFTTSEFANHYKELYIRWYIKIPAGWDADISSGYTHKLNRIWAGTSAGATSTEWYMDVKGASTFKNCYFSFYNTDQGGVFYTTKTISQLGINDGSWHSIEWHLKLNTTTGSTDGGFAFYVDGSEVQINGYSGASYGIWNINMGAATNTYFTSTLTPGIGNLSGGSWTFPTAGWYAIEFDDYAVSTTRIGTTIYSSTSTSSDSAPSTPTGVTITIIQ